MQIKTKQRLVGLLILLATLAIFLPLLFHNSHPAAETQSFVGIPPKPSVNYIQNTQQRGQVQLPLAPTSTLLANSVSSSGLQARNGVGKAEAETLAKAGPVAREKYFLPKRKVPVQSKQNDAVYFIEAPKAWCVKLGTFHNVENANNLIAKLRKQGFDAYTRPILNEKRERLLQVYVGPEIKKENAEQLKDKLEVSLHIKGLVCKYKIKT